MIKINKSVAPLPRYLRHFPGFIWPVGFSVPAGFEDVSNSTEYCPCFHHKGKDITIEVDWGFKRKRKNSSLPQFRISQRGEYLQGTEFAVHCLYAINKLIRSK